jgi:hypothetical protein
MSIDIDYMFGISDAIKRLRPNAKFELYNSKFTQYWDETGLPQPSWDEVIAQFEYDKKIYESLQYARDRKANYPKIEDQLDMLWHAMDSGQISGKETEWYNTIKSVKETYLKP